MHIQIRNRIQAYNDAMDHSKLVLAQAFASQGEAELAKSMLESAGIDAMILADTVGGMRPHVAWSGLGFRVLVREEDEIDARQLLQPPESELVLVQTFGTRAEADLAQGALLEAGIVATVEADPTDSLRDQGRVRVLVRGEDAATAREVLNVNPPRQPTHK
ncbi:MAG: hypothetical protein DMG40_04360 [Acidobacteria bacterium]|nr:MAG: hypothetical protein DMG40_04360 [Acidobacteriota bacterium]